MTEQTFAHVVQQALQAEVDLIVAAEAKEAAKRVEMQVREKTAQIATRIFDRMTVERNVVELVIRVDIGSFRK